MTKDIIKCSSNKLEEILMPKLKGNVFHVTSKSNFKGILKKNQIKNNKKYDFAFTFGQSKNSYGRKRGYVCLFDLRFATEEQIVESFYKYYFLNPDHVNNNPIFLIISEDLYPSLISWEKAKNECNVKEMYIPYIECWYPGDISVDKIKEVIEVEVNEDINNDGTWASMIRLANNNGGSLGSVS